MAEVATLDPQNEELERLRRGIPQFAPVARLDPQPISGPMGVTSTPRPPQGGPMIGGGGAPLAVPQPPGPPPVQIAPHDADTRRAMVRAAQLEQGQSGISKIHGVGGGILKGLQAVGNIFVPGVMAQIPGTDLNYMLKTRGAEMRAKAAQEREKESAGIEHTQAETEEARARAYNLLQPKTEKIQDKAIHSYAGDDGKIHTIFLTPDNQTYERVSDVGAADKTKEPSRDDKAIAIYSKPKEQWTADDQAYIKGYEDWVNKTKTEPGVVRANIFAAPRWAEYGLHKTGLDLKIAKETGKLPTGDIMQRGQFAAELLPHLPMIRQEIQEAEKRGLLGPLMGRGTEFMLGRVGTTGDPKTDAFYAKLRTDLHLLSSGLNRAHFGGRAGAETLKYFDDLIGQSFRSKAALNGFMDSAGDYLGTYATAVPTFGEGGTYGGQTIAPMPGAGAESGPGGPAVGMVKDGYRFKGGDPGKPESWEKVK